MNSVHTPFLVAGFLFVSAVSTPVSVSPTCPAVDYLCTKNTVPTHPVGNDPLTYTSFSLHGATAQSSAREFLVDLGMESSTGNVSVPPTTPFHDKVTLYTSIVGLPGTGDIWAMNPLVTQSPNSGDYAAQGIELDFNNNNAHRGDSDAGTGLGGAVSYGLSVTGAGQYRSTSAFLVSGPGTHKIWNRGIVFANNCIRSSTFQDLGSPEKSVDIRGNPTYGIYQSSTTTKNYFAGKTVHSGELRAYGGRHVVTTGERVRSEHVYSGNVMLDMNGGAAVALVEEGSGSRRKKKNATFGEEYVYSLTSIGAPPKSLHVKNEVDQDGMFTIAGGPQYGKVSWVVRSRIKR